MPVREILILGNPRLHTVCDPVDRSELDAIGPVVTDLHDTMMNFRQRYGVGRAIAAPQIDVMKRLVYMHIDQPTFFINPELTDFSEEQFALWDDCMSFPDLLVNVLRHCTCRITYRDLEWNEQSMTLDGDLSELLQHECDHLDGILAVSRAIDRQSFAYRSQRNRCNGL